eukprot:GHUV01044241.1.p1 GENE.GHUV01044241.1~~GHUV01044241.1.p1  ORF type:complete len:215 (+),score=34.90 GHUV01044241.1:3-647(+)
MMNLFRLIMPHGGMWRWIGQMLFTGAASFNHAATERYRSLIIYPASIRYGREPGLILLILLMGVAYSVAAPLITPFVLAYFCTAYLVWRYQMIHVCVRCYESGGKMWPVYFVIVLWCLGECAWLACQTAALLAVVWQDLSSWQECKECSTACMPCSSLQQKAASPPPLLSILLAIPEVILCCCCALPQMIARPQVDAGCNFLLQVYLWCSPAAS